MINQPNELASKNKNVLVNFITDASIISVVSFGILKTIERVLQINDIDSNGLISLVKGFGSAFLGIVTYYYLKPKIINVAKNYLASKKPESNSK